MEKVIRNALHSIGDQTSIESMKQVSGGDINQSYYIRTSKKPYFIKGNEGVPSHFFKVEADGLERIQKTRTIQVPQVHYYDEPENGEKGVLVMDWIQQGGQASPEELGRNLALMHKETADQYGLGHSTFVGELDQPNDWKTSWLEYYRDYRLAPQLHLAVQNGRASAKRRSKLEALLEKLDQWIPEKPEASLLHGDLWGGNWMSDAEGRPYLIDPSVLYGDHAFELAFTELFGGFPSTFYKAYEQTFPLPSNYEEVKPLYQLFYLLVHLNMFGESYGSSVDRILKHYTD
ncbi:fructosamine kinase family protein [Halobacillus sp. B29]|uniref:fructosamine kinase family protein n=1 Tax=Halobacillus sp. B29 TaxID=3457432 RepID=UPI003FCCAB62